MEGLSATSWVIGSGDELSKSLQDLLVLKKRLFRK
jgi:hypothetical protein